MFFSSQAYIKWNALLKPSLDFVEGKLASVWNDPRHNICQRSRTLWTPSALWKAVQSYVHVYGSPCKYCSQFISRREVWSALTYQLCRGPSVSRDQRERLNILRAHLITGCPAASERPLTLKGTTERHLDRSPPRRTAVYHTNKLGNIMYSGAHPYMKSLTRTHTHMHLTHSTHTICSSSTRTGRRSSALVRRRSRTETK